MLLEKLKSYLVCDLCSKQPPSTPGANGPGVYILWVRPDQVTESSLMGDFLVTLNGSDLIQSLYVWREAAMNTQDLLIHQLKISNIQLLFLYHQKKKTFFYLSFLL